MTLATAVRLAVAEAETKFRSHGLKSIKDICSSKDGGLGKRKIARVVGGRDALGPSADEPAVVAAGEGLGPGEPAD